MHFSSQTKFSIKFLNGLTNLSGLCPGTIVIVPEDGCKKCEIDDSGLGLQRGLLQHEQCGHQEKERKSDRVMNPPEHEEGGKHQHTEGGEAQKP